MKFLLDPKAAPHYDEDMVATKPGTEIESDKRMDLLFPGKFILKSEPDKDENGEEATPKFQMPVVDASRDDKPPSRILTPTEDDELKASASEEEDEEEQSDSEREDVTGNFSAAGDAGVTIFKSGKNYEIFEEGDDKNRLNKGKLMTKPSVNAFLKKLMK